jgi:hypothetical protein
VVLAGAIALAVFSGFMVLAEMLMSIFDKQGMFVLDALVALLVGAVGSQLIPFLLKRFWELTHTVGSEAEERRHEWSRYGRLAMASAKRLAANDAFIDRILTQRKPFVLLLRSWAGETFGHVVAGKDASHAGRWARVAATVLPVIALEQPGSQQVSGIFSPAVPRTGWDEMVRRLIRAAQRIIVVIEGVPGEGLRLELDELRRAGRLCEALVLLYGVSSDDSGFALVAYEVPEADVQADEAVAQWVASGDSAVLARAHGFMGAAP